MARLPEKFLPPTAPFAPDTSPTTELWGLNVTQSLDAQLDALSVRSKRRNQGAASNGNHADSSSNHSAASSSNGPSVKSRPPKRPYSDIPPQKFKANVVDPADADYLGEMYAQAWTAKKTASSKASTLLSAEQMTLEDWQRVLHKNLNNAEKRYDALRELRQQVHFTDGDLKVAGAQIMEPPEELKLRIGKIRQDQSSYENGKQVQAANQKLLEICRMLVESCEFLEAHLEFGHQLQLYKKKAVKELCLIDY